MSSPVCLVELSRPGNHRKPVLTREDSTLLCTATLHDELHVFALLAAGARKDKTLEIFPEMMPDADGCYCLELGVTLPDLLPTFDDHIDYRVAVRTRRHGASTLCISNQMARVNCYRDSRLTHILVPEPALGQLHEHGIKVSEKPPYAILRTTVAMKFRIAAPSVDYALEHHLEECAEDLAGALNDYLAAYIMIERDLFSTHSTAFDSRSFDVLYFAINGAENTKARVGRIALHAGRTVLNPADVSGDRLRDMLQFLSGSKETDAIKLMLATARNSHQSGLLRAALLQMVVAAEMAIARFVRDEYIRAGVSKGKWQEAKKDMSYSQMLNLHLFALSPIDFKPDRDLLGQLNAARGLRNEFMHEGVFTPDRTRIGQLLEATDKFLLYLTELQTRKVALRNE